MRRAQTDTGNEKVNSIQNSIYNANISQTTIPLMKRTFIKVFLSLTFYIVLLSIVYIKDKIFISTWLFGFCNTWNYLTFSFFLFLQSQLLSKSVLEISASLLPFDFTDFGNSKSVILSDVTNDGMSKSLKRQKTSSPQKKVKKKLLFCFCHISFNFNSCYSTWKHLCTKEIQL